MTFTPKTWANDAAGATPISAAELNRIEAGVEASLQLDEDQIVAAAGVKRFPPTTLLMRNADGTAHAEPYSDVNAPETLERTILAVAPTINPPAGESFEWSADGKSLDMRAADGTTTRIGPGAGGGGGGAITVYKKTADQTITGLTFVDIADWTVPLPANSSVSIDAMLFFSSSATTNGFAFAATPQTLAGLGFTPSRFLVVFEYQTAATTWATFSQTAPGTPMAATAATYVANSGVLCRIMGQITMGAEGGQLKMQAKAELGTSSVTVRQGNLLRAY